jgi:hypothetical protein
MGNWIKSFFKIDEKDPLIKREKLRQKISGWMTIFMIILFFFVNENLKAFETFFDLSRLIISAGIVLFVTLAIKDFRKGIIRREGALLKNLKNKIQGSIEKEQEIGFDKIDDKIEEHAQRGELYSYFSGGQNFDLVKKIIVSIFLSFFYIIIYGIYSTSLNQSIIGNIMVTNIILLLSFLVSLHYLLNSIVYIGLHFLD